MITVKLCTQQANELYEVKVCFKGRAIIDALGCWSCDLEPVD